MTILNLDSIKTTAESIWKKFSKNDALDKENRETESNSKLGNNLFQDTLADKGKGHRNFENFSFSFLKKTKSGHPKNMFFGHFKKSFKILLIFSFPVKLKLIPPSQVSNLVSRSTEFSERILKHIGADYVNQDLNCKVLTNNATRQDSKVLAL